MCILGSVVMMALIRELLTAFQVIAVLAHPFGVERTVDVRAIRNYSLFSSFIYLFWLLWLSRFSNSWRFRRACFCRTLVSKNGLLSSDVRQSLLKFLFFVLWTLIHFAVLMSIGNNGVWFFETAAFFRWGSYPVILVHHLIFTWLVRREDDLSESANVNTDCFVLHDHFRMDLRFEVELSFAIVRHGGEDLGLRSVAWLPLLILVIRELNEFIVFGIKLEREGV